MVGRAGLRGEAGDRRAAGDLRDLHLLYLRPILGSFLAIFFPYSWINNDRMRGLFFRGTQSEFELTWKARGQPTNARWRYLFDVIYYTGPILVVISTLAVLFIVFVGYPGYLR